MTVYEGSRLRRPGGDRGRLHRTPLVRRARRASRGRHVSSALHGPARAHPAGGGLPPLVPGRRQQGGAGRERAGARDDDHQAVGLRAVGAHPARDGRPHQGDRPRQRLLPAVHPGVVPAQGGRARRGVQPGARGRDPRRRRGAGRAAGRAPDVRDRHRRRDVALDPGLPRPARCCSTSGPTSCAGSCARGCSCAPPSSSGRRATPRTRRARRPRPRRC